MGWTTGKVAWQVTGAALGTRRKGEAGSSWTHLPGSGRGRRGRCMCRPAQNARRLSGTCSTPALRPEPAPRHAAAQPGMWQAGTSQAAQAGCRLPCCNPGCRSCCRVAPCAPAPQVACGNQCTTSLRSRHEQEAARGTGQHLMDTLLLHVHPGRPTGTAVSPTWPCCCSADRPPCAAHPWCPGSACELRPSPAWASAWLQGRLRRLPRGCCRTHPPCQPLALLPRGCCLLLGTLAVPAARGWEIHCVARTAAHWQTAHHPRPS